MQQRQHTIMGVFCPSRPYGVVSRAGRAYISPGRPFYPNTSHLVIFLSIWSKSEVTTPEVTTPSHLLVFQRAYISPGRPRNLEFSGQ